MKNDQLVPQTTGQVTVSSLEGTARDEGPPPIETSATIRLGYAVLVGFVVAVIAWCFFVPMGAGVQAPGEVIFQGKRQSVQHLEGGIIKTIFVKDGDVVQMGQPLIELEPSQVQPMVQMLEQQDAAEIAQIARLEAESKGLPQIVFPKALMDQAKNPEISKVMQNETRLFQARRAAHGNQIQLLRLQVRQLRETIKGLEDSLAAKKREIATITEQLTANRVLQHDGYVSRAVILDIQRQLAEKSGQKDTLAASLASERQRVHELEQRIVTLNSDRVQAATGELKQSSLRRIDLQERIRPVKDTLERQIIKSPVAGKVVGLKVSTVGGVIMPRDTIMEIAPLRDELIVEAKVRVEDVNRVKVGQKARVTISGLDLRVMPPLNAEVTYISADRIVPSPSQGQQPPYFAAKLKIVDELIKNNTEVEIMPGMTAQVAIAVKPRTASTYLFDPLLARIRKAIYAN